MSWTDASDLRKQVQSLWDKGRLLAALVDGEAAFPLRLVLKVPGSADLSERFDEVRRWARELIDGAKAPDGHGYRLAMRQVRHRVIGENALPCEAWLDGVDDALALIGRLRDGRRFGRLLAQVRSTEPALLPWLQANPLRALQAAEDFPRLLEFVAWLRARPRPGVYLRQVDLPGIHSKFIEAHRPMLGELLDLCLPAEAIDAAISGAAGFAPRYGFLQRPGRVRLRMLDAGHTLLGTGAAEDITMNREAFMKIEPPVSRVFITENEINFLAFPPLAESLVIFGAGYGVDAIAEAPWLQAIDVRYWGDIDTHGFAILDQLRGRLAHARSMLMDSATLMAHEAQWSEEAQPVLRDLPRLDAADRAVYDALRWKRLGARQVRLEQERIGFGWVERALADAVG